MSAALRRVRRVRLAAPTEALARRGSLLLEDALRTASIAGAGEGPLLVVRRLEVGRIRPDAPPATLALCIEALLRAVPPVHAADPAAASAPAVWFRDEAEAAAMLAVRLASGLAADAWFWRAALPGLSGDAAAGVALALGRAAASPAGPAAVAAVLAFAHERGAVERVLALCSTTVAREVLAACGWAAPPDVPAGVIRGGGASSGARPEAVLADAPPSAWTPVLARWVASAGADDPRTTLLVAAALVDAQPSLAGDPRFPVRVGALAARLVARRAATAEGDGAAEGGEGEGDLRGGAWTPGRPAGSTAEADYPAPMPSGARPEDGGPAPSDGARAAASGTVRAPPRPRREAPPPDRGAPPPPHHGVDGAPAAPRPRAAGEAPRAEDGIDPGAATVAGGLFFLVALLDRLDLAGGADHTLPRRILLRIAERTRVPEDDPVRLLLADARPECAPPAADEDAGAARLRRWCRTEARIGLYDLVRRRGRVTATRTHLDLAFPLARAEVRIRAAGLDVDPGWVPWLGRVVAFHYED